MNWKFYLKEAGKFLVSTTIAFLPEVLGKVTPEFTLVGQAATAIGYTWQALGIRKKYMQDVLPEAITKVLDKTPNKITGVKGSKKLPSGYRGVE